MKIMGVFILILMSLIVGHSQQKQDSLITQTGIEVSFCDLIENAEKYKDKEVTVKATYKYGFEHAELYCLGCEDQAWVEFDESFKNHSKSKYLKKIKSNGDQGRTVNVEVVGTLFSGGGFGHLGFYPYLFVVKSLKNAEVVANVGLNPHALSNEEQKKICQK